MKGLLILMPAVLVMASAAAAADAGEPPLRIVSTAPNLTEILFELGLGDRVVGVSDFCTHPEEAKAKPRIGGFVDTSIEAIVVLRPDLVVLLESNSGGIRQLESLRVPMLVVRDESLEDIREAVRVIGSRCGAVEAADALLQKLDALARPAPPHSDGAERPRVLVCFGRIERGGQPASFYAAAEGSLFDELVGLAGGRSAIADSALLYPQVSVEGVHAIDPDIVIELTGAGDPGFRGSLTGGLGPLQELRAVRDGRWQVVEGEWAVRPGPRIFQLIEPIAREIDAWREARP